MKVVFLDVDGVLNNGKWATRMWESEGVSVYNNDMLYEPSLLLLKRLIDETGALIVVSSTWRKIPRCIKSLTAHLAYHNLEIYSMTDALPGERGDEIGAWLAQHQDVDKYVILDDDSDMGEYLPHLVQTDFDIGFRMRDYELAKAMLMEGESECSAP